MKRFTLLFALVGLCLSSGLAQETSTSNAVAVPHLVRFSGLVRDAAGQPLSGTMGVTFALYRDQEGGAPLWLETQNVVTDNNGHYTVSLGTTKADGLPVELFTSGEARWLGVQPDGQAEQPRVLLLSVPYALKAADAETVGGLPSSAFVLAAPVTNGDAGLSSTTNSTSATASVHPPASSDVTTTGGAVNAFPLFTTATNVQNSILTQTGTTAVNVKGLLNLSATGTASAAGGKNSQAENYVASVFNSGTSTAVTQTFQLRAEPVNNNTATASGTLNLLYGSGTSAPAETGLKISNKGIISFASGQTFPGAGTGTITGVTAGTDLTGGGTTGKVVLNLDTTKVPRLAAANTFVANQQINGTLTVSQGFNVTGNSLINISDGQALQVTQSGPNGGVAILGSAIATGSERNYGVEGDSTSTVAGSTGILGFDESTTGAGGFTIGVQGASSNTPSGMGVLGFDGTSLSSVFARLAGGFPAGVWGDGGPASNFGTGVIGTMDDGAAALFINNSPTGVPTLEVIGESAGSPLFVATNNITDAFCNIDSGGNLSCSGSKNAVVRIDGGKRIVAMSAIEAPQNWFEDFGSAQLVNGVAVVTLDQDFIQTVNSETNYKVFPVPNGECKGLYVTNKTAKSFEVRELGGGASNVGFDYRITVLRKNYENVRFADHTHDLDGIKKMQERMKAGTGKPVHLPTAAQQP
jgi:hypothetical protein